MTFDELLNERNWKPIHNCPGRYVLQASPCIERVAEIINEEVTPVEHRVDAAQDLVLVAKIEGGGLISYKRPDGTFIHTLNTPEGFGRKLQQLGIQVP